MISVVVPLYNVELYIERCIKSILIQTYKDFELLLIDDGSTDGSGKICDAYAQSDRRIRVFHKKNEGVAEARNYALDKIGGNYIAFIDGDDFVGKDYLKILMDSVEEHHVEFAAIGWELNVTGRPNVNCGSNKCLILNKHETFKELLIGQRINVAPWGKLFKSELFYNVRFPKVKVYEDYLVIPYIIDQCDKCAFTSVTEYYYFQRDGSAVRSEKMFFEYKVWVTAIQKLCFYTEANYPDLTQYAEGRLVKEIFRATVDWLLFSDNYIDIALEIKRKFNKYLSKIFILPNLSNRDRIKAFLFLLNVRFYRWVAIVWLNFTKDDNNRVLLNAKK